MRTAKTLLRRLATTLALTMTLGMPCAGWGQSEPTLKTGRADKATPAAAASAASASASASSQPIQLAVTVRDKKGKPVEGLTQADFTLLEDGRPEPIVSFVPASTLPLSLVLILDTGESMDSTLDAQRTAAKAFLASVLTKPTDKAALLHFDREVELLEDLTSSQARLDAGVAELGPTHASGSGEGTGANPENGDEGRGDIGAPSRGRYAGNQLFDAIYLASHDLLATAPGRRVIVILTDGVDRGSKEREPEATEAAVKAGAAVYTIYFKGEEQHGSTGNGQNGNGQGGQGGQRRGGIGFPGGGYPGGGGGGYPGGGGGGYPGGSGGNRRQREPEPAHVDGKAVLGRIATKTGGWPFEAKKPANFDDLFKEIGNELSRQVEITYKPDPVGRGAVFHRITLKTRDKDQFVQVREGYYGADPDAN